MQIPDSSLIADIYKTPTEPGQWQALLDRICHQVGARGSALLALDLSGLYDYQITFGNSIYPPATLRAYESRFSVYEEKHFRRVAAGPAHVAQYDQDFERVRQGLLDRPDIDFLKTEYGVHERIAVKVSEDDSWFDCLTLQFATGRSNIKPDERERLQHYLPHIAEALVLSRCFRLLQQQFGAVLSVLDRVETGLVLVNRYKQPVLANAHARRILELRDGLQLGPSGELDAAHSNTASMLTLALRRACATSSGKDSCANTLLMVPRRSGGDPYIVDISPLQDTQNEIDTRFHGALVTIIDPDVSPSLSLDGLARVYDLSEAELAVTALLVDGLTNQEIADSRGVSIETIKSQVQSVYRKFNVGNRSLLIRKALRVSLPVRLGR